MEILKNTPIWIYILFFYLLYRGVEALKERTTGLPKLLLVPAIFIIWNLSWLLTHIEGTYSYFVLWLIGLPFGSIVGWQSVRTWKMKIHKKQKTITLPGNASTLLLILITFAVRYYLRYEEAKRITPSHDFFLVEAAILGLLTGMFVGRAFEFYRKFSNARN